jgi:hypothetical protein
MMNPALYTKIKTLLFLTIVLMIICSDLFKLQVEIFCKARLRLALQKISTCSLTHDVSSLEDDNIKYLN